MQPQALGLGSCNALRQARPFTAGGASQQLQQQRVAAAPRRSPSTQQQRARRRAPPVPQAVGAHDLTATLLEQVTSLALRARLKEARAVSTEISCDAMSLLAGRVNSVTIKGEGWRSPLDLTAQLLECSVGAAALDYSRVLAGQIVLTNVPTGTARVVFDERDFGNFLAHPLVARQAAAAVKGAPFDFDRASVRLEAPSAARPGGAVYFTGTCRADGGRYQVELLPVARASGGGGGGSGLAAAGWPGVQAHAIALGVGGRASGANAVGDALTAFFNRLTVDLEGVELRLMSMRVAPGTGFAGALADLRMQLTVRRFPPLNVRF